MTFWSSCVIRVGSIALAALAFPGMTVAEQRPELTGIWTNVSATPLSRPAGVDRLVLTAQQADNVVKGLPVYGIPRDALEAEKSGVSEDEAPDAGSEDFGVRAYNAFWMDPGDSLALVKGEFRSSYIVEPDNGQIPRRPQTARDRQGPSRYLTGVGSADGPEALPISERCLIGFGNTGGPGMLSVMYNNNYQIVQTDDHVMILVEMVHDARIIPTFGSEKQARANHRPDAIKPWLGDSVGWYEDGALMVETINLHPLQARSSSIPITENGRILERFERYSDSEIFYSFTVEDDALYTKPWTAELSFHATRGPIYEYACHEGNYAMENMLRGARLEESRTSN
ncbi:hypothetical protein F6455_07495 [Proteobacteria bacterium 005FR1]|nr:hypothetical protein [Proteobacteria bacterium 005FR1]